MVIFVFSVKFHLFAMAGVPMCGSVNNVESCLSAEIPATCSFPDITHISDNISRSCWQQR